MQLYYETERLKLRVLTSSYAEQVLEFYQNNKHYFNIWEPSRVRNFYTRDFQRASLSYEYHEIIKSRFLRFWIFEKSDDERIIGCICFQNFQKGSLMSCTVGYKVDEAYTRQGYATEALEKCMDIIFNELHFHRIEAMIHPLNISSIKLVERNGFMFEGIAKSCIKLNNKWIDHLRYARINPND